MLIDLDAWYTDEAKFNREAHGKTGGAGAGDGSDDAMVGGSGGGPVLTGMHFRPKTGSDVRAMTWPEFRNFNVKLHAALSRVRPVHA